MLLTRPRRKVIFGSILAALTLAVFVAVGWWRPAAPRFAAFYGGDAGVSEQIDVEYYAIGLTDWLLIIEQRPMPGRAVGPFAPPKVIDRNFRVNPTGAMEALFIVGAAVAISIWAYRRLVYRLRVRGYCDWCGYDLRGTTSGRCPECGAPVAGETAPAGA